MPAPTKQRPGDQRLPDVNDRPCVQDAIIADMEESKRIGEERYGTVLQPFNGRDTLLDARDEARDMLVYLTAFQMERAEMVARLEAVLSLLSFTDMSEAYWSELTEILVWLRGDPA